MRHLRIKLIAVVCVLWVGAVWAAKAPLPQTGQVISYDANNPQKDDGALQKGVELPTPRFIDNGDGTIKDKLTGLIWLKNANCPGASRSWQTALSDVASLNSAGTMNGNNCGDTSGKKGDHRTDWRLPNIRELHSLVDFAFSNPALSNAAGTGQGNGSDPFSNFQFPSFYWSSTTIAFKSSIAWFVDFFVGNVVADTKSNSFFVIAVRGSS